MKTILGTGENIIQNISMYLDPKKTYEITIKEITKKEEVRLSKEDVRTICKEVEEAYKNG